VRTEALGTDISNACELTYYTDRTTCDDTGSFGSLLEKNVCASVLSDKIVRDGIVIIKGYLDDVLNSIFLALTDSFGNFLSLAKSDAYVTVFVTYNYKCSKAGIGTALYDLGNSLDRNDLVLEL
jgi:hypothetical protein